MEQRTELTQIHGLVIQALELLGYDHRDEHLIEVDGEEFQFDCYLPVQHVCIEADGPSHGMRGKRDARRDALLLTVGIPTLRIRWDLIEHLTPEELSRHIDIWVKRWNPSLSYRRALTPPTDGITRVPREECTCPDDCLRHEDIGGL